MLFITITIALFAVSMAGVVGPGAPPDTTTTERVTYDPCATRGGPFITVTTDRPTRRNPFGPFTTGAPPVYITRPPIIGPFEPIFVGELTRDQRKQFEKINKDESLTIAEKEIGMAKLADKFGISDSYKEFQAKRIAKLDEINKKAIEVMGNLEMVNAKLVEIYSNKDQTRHAEHEAVKALREKYHVEVEVIHFIRERLGGQHGHRGGPHGRRGH